MSGGLQRLVIVEFDGQLLNNVWWSKRRVGVVLEGGLSLWSVLLLLLLMRIAASIRRERRG